MIRGLKSFREVDAIFINSPLKNYDIHPRRNDFTLPVLGLGYIATYLKEKSLNIGVLDAEALGLGISHVAQIINKAKPRWVGLNLLAPTYRYSIQILECIDPEIAVMLGGHQAKAMPLEILSDSDLPRIDALILGEGEYRAAAVIQDTDQRQNLPNVWWRDGNRKPQTSVFQENSDKSYWLAPNVDTLPFVDREFLSQDPFETEGGLIEANLIGSRGCPYDCSFCGAAISANPDISIRTRNPYKIIEEIEAVHKKYGATVFRFVDDLFLASPPFMKKCLPVFREEKIGERFRWDATGRINVLCRLSEEMLNLLVETGCREVALGIESGNERLLNYMGKRITPEMTKKAVQALIQRGINVKGYFIFGFPTETQSELEDTISHIYELWELSDRHEGTFRCSAFEFRPYPGTPEWSRLIASGKYSSKQLLLYEQVDLTGNGAIKELLDRDEFNFSVNIQFGETPVESVRKQLSNIMIAQKQRLYGDAYTKDHVQRPSYS